MSQSGLGRSRPSGLLLGVVVTALVAGACVDQDVGSAQADRASELQAAVEPLGVTVPEGIAASLYGTDGGLVCEAASDPDLLATYAPLANNRFPLRPTRADEDTVAYARAVVSTYCPDRLDSFDEHVDGLNVGERN